MYKGAILNIQSNSKKASSCPDIYNNNSTLTVTSEPDSVSIRPSRWRFTSTLPAIVYINIQIRKRSLCCVCVERGISIPQKNAQTRLYTHIRIYKIYTRIIPYAHPTIPLYTFLQMSHRDSIVKVINQLSNKRVNTIRRVRRKRSYFHPKTVKKVRRAWRCPHVRLLRVYTRDTWQWRARVMIGASVHTRRRCIL